MSLPAPFHAELAALQRGGKFIVDQDQWRYVLGRLEGRSDAELGPRFVHTTPSQRYQWKKRVIDRLWNLISPAFRDWVSATFPRQRPRKIHPRRIGPRKKKRMRMEKDRIRNYVDPEGGL